MRHKKNHRRLGVNTSQRVALLRGLCKNIAEKGSINTTLARAKELRRMFEKLVTLGKKDSLHAFRLIYQRTGSKAVAMKIFKDYAKRFKDRPGGYTRIYKLKNRYGDNSEMAKICLVDFELPVKKTTSKKSEEKAKAKA